MPAVTLKAVNATAARISKAIESARVDPDGNLSSDAIRAAAATLKKRAERDVFLGAAYVLSEDETPGISPKDLKKLVEGGRVGLSAADANRNGVLEAKEVYSNIREKIPQRNIDALASLLYDASK